MPWRINIVGAAGSGTTTLGQALAKKLELPHIEADDFLWLPTDPPYQTQREYTEKNELAYNTLSKKESFVLSGSISSWEQRVVSLLNLVVYLDIPKELRLKRLLRREEERYGKIDPDFYEWAAQYDEGQLPGRSRKRHEEWIKGLSCRVVRINSATTVEKQLEDLLPILAQDGE